ncbi:Hsp70-Hsp90 organizing protein 3 [Eumeta japonica]|uniref:Hsp70-Hsp90 organizing protein 3 n=1 Tax=Eumeta variegata TaxID=151549 RepID=A0A4C1X8R1_EUMVA|nr:Hsp70-Hsp90 organizing protein 3 [Eumeta japonica]
MEDSKKTQSSNNVEEIKNKGNECVKEGKFVEAVLHYTQGIKIDPANYVLYSNRSFAFLKLDQHYLALEDANETVRLQPQWAKGYFRRAEVEAASGLYDEAIISYTRALQLEPLDTKLMDCIKAITDKQKKKIRDNEKLIWVCTCIGLVVGLIVVICDYALTEKSTLNHPLSMVAFSLALAGVGWGVGKSAALMNTWSAGKSLAPPEDLDEKSPKSRGMHCGSNRVCKVEKILLVSALFGWWSTDATVSIFIPCIAKSVGTTHETATVKLSRKRRNGVKLARRKGRGTLNLCITSFAVLMISGGARRRRPPTASRLKGPRKQKSFAYKLLKRGLANLMSPTSTSGVAPPLLMIDI